MVIAVRCEAPFVAITFRAVLLMQIVCRIAFLDFSSELDAAKTYHENLNGVIVNGCSLTLIPTKDKISNSRRGLYVLQNLLK